MLQNGVHFKIWPWCALWRDPPHPPFFFGNTFPFTTHGVYILWRRIFVYLRYFFPHRIGQIAFLYWFQWQIIFFGHSTVSLALEAHKTNKRRDKQKYGLSCYPETLSRKLLCPEDVWNLRVFYFFIFFLHFILTIATMTHYNKSINIAVCFSSSATVRAITLENSPALS